jgi:hypothetical protein
MHWQVMKMVIKIGTAHSVKNPESWENTPDDRQTLIKIINGVYVEDNGLIADGEIISCQAIFDAVNWTIVKGYWYGRTMVEVVDHAGNSLGNKRIVVKKYSYVDKFINYYTVTLEFWNQ